MKNNAMLHSLLLLCGALPLTMAVADPGAEREVLERGRYLMIVGGCNDCHTAGYMETAGNIPEDRWLTGNALGFQGPWGTTYPVNLRLYVQEMTEAQWLERVRLPMGPPMPWFNLREMTDADLAAMYRYLDALGPAGDPAPAAAAPGVAVTTPYFDFVPKNVAQNVAQ
jgi:mono/diheme cytochrome c family protein